MSGPGLIGKPKNMRDVIYSNRQLQSGTNVPKRSKVEPLSLVINII